MGTWHHPQIDGAAFIVTAVVHERASVFRSRGACRLFLRELTLLRNELSFRLLAWVIMPDHVHLLVAPSPQAQLRTIMQGSKGRFARRWNELTYRRGSLWQARYYESTVRTEAQLIRWVEYIESNPVKAGMVRSAEEYSFSSAWAGRRSDLESYLG
jgi:putative transposase